MAHPFSLQRGGAAVAAVALSLVLVQATQAQTAARDSQSSSLRAPTTEEAAALAAKPNANARTAPKGLLTGKVNPQPVRYRDGTVSVELDESTLMYSVARRNPDGSMSMYCVPAAEAQGIVNGTQAVSKTSKEHGHDLSK